MSVLQWTADAKAAGARWGIPTGVLLALVDVESSGIPGRTSSADAQGITQFIPSTARQYGVDVRPGHEASQLDGTAHYLHDLGFKQNAALALAKYNAGPANPGAGAGYAQKVLGLAHSRYGGTLPTTSSTTPTLGATTSSTGDTKGGGGIFNGLEHAALYALLWLALALGGASLAGLGVARATGLRQAHGAVA